MAPETLTFKYCGLAAKKKRATYSTVFHPTSGAFHLVSTAQAWNHTNRIYTTHDLSTSHLRRTLRCCAPHHLMSSSSNKRINCAAFSRSYIQFPSIWRAPPPRSHISCVCATRRTGVKCVEIGIAGVGVAGETSVSSTRIRQKSRPFFYFAAIEILCTGCAYICHTSRRGFAWTAQSVQTHTCAHTTPRWGTDKSAHRSPSATINKPHIYTTHKINKNKTKSGMDGRYLRRLEHIYVYDASPLIRPFDERNTEGGLARALTGSAHVWCDAGSVWWWCGEKKRVLTEIGDGQRQFSLTSHRTQQLAINKNSKCFTAKFRIYIYILSSSAYFAALAFPGS